MKIKLKKFYQNNEKTILICSGVVLGSLTTAYFANVALNGMRLADAGLYSDTESGQMFLHVVLENGSSKNYLWDPNRT